MTATVPEATTSTVDTPVTDTSPNTDEKAVHPVRTLDPDVAKMVDEGNPNVD